MRVNNARLNIKISEKLNFIGIEFIGNFVISDTNMGQPGPQNLSF